MKLYVTYAQNSYQEDNYSVVEADTEDDCRKKVFEGTEGKFAFTYAEEDFAGQKEKYGLTEIPLQPNIRWDS